MMANPGWEGRIDRCKRLLRARRFTEAYLDLCRMVRDASAPPELRSLHERARALLLREALTLIAPLHRVPKLVQTLEALSSGDDIDPRTAYLLSQIDGQTSVESLLAFVSLPKNEIALRILVLIERGILAWSR